MICYPFHSFLYHRIIIVNSPPGLKRAWLAAGTCCPSHCMPGSDLDEWETFSTFPAKFPEFPQISSFWVLEDTFGWFICPFYPKFFTLIHNSGRCFGSNWMLLRNLGLQKPNIAESSRGVLQKNLSLNQKGKRSGLRPCGYYIVQQQGCTFFFLSPKRQKSKSPTQIVRK